MKNSNIELVKAMIIASHDYGYYRMNWTAMSWLRKKDPILAKLCANAVFKDAEHIRKQEYFKELVRIAEARPLHRIN